MGDDLLGSFTTQLYGASLTASYRSALLTLAFTSTAVGAKILRPFGGVPAFNSLIKEAVAEARDTTFEQTPTRVLRAEHLVAIMLQTGRNKDRERLASFIGEVPLNETYLAGVLERHRLTAKWQECRGI